MIAIARKDASLSEAAQNRLTEIDNLIMEQRRRAISALRAAFDQQFEKDTIERFARDYADHQCHGREGPVPRIESAYQEARRNAEGSGREFQDEIKAIMLGGGGS